jgi:hypothetical protein
VFTARYVLIPYIKQITFRLLKVKAKSNLRSDIRPVSVKFDFQASEGKIGVSAVTSLIRPNIRTHIVLRTPENRRTPERIGQIGRTLSTYKTYSSHHYLRDVHPDPRRTERRSEIPSRILLQEYLCVRPLLTDDSLLST